MEKRVYVKHLKPDDVKYIVSKLIDVDIERIEATSTILISPTMASISFKVKDDEDYISYNTLFKNAFECWITFFEKTGNFTNIYKKSFGNIMSEIIDKKHLQGVTKLTSKEYQEDYNAYHQQVFKQMQAKQEEFNKQLF